MLNALQFEAQNARVTKSLSNEGASSSLFALYLSMQLADPFMHVACNLNTIEAGSSYSSIDKLRFELQRSPKPNLYSSESDYLAQRQLYSDLQRSSQPSTYLHFLNAFMPQPLHYSAQAVLLADDVVANLPLETHGIYAKTALAENAVPSPSNVNQMHNEDPVAGYANTSNDDTSVPDQLPQQAILDAFLQTIKHSRELDL